MRELLFLPENLAHPLQWATYNADGYLALHDPMAAESLNAYKNLSKKGVTLVLTGHKAHSYRFSMPKVSGQAKQQAISFALEGICSQSLEEVYVIPGDYIHGKQSAVIVDRCYLDDVLNLVKDNGLKVTGIYIDYMLLKNPDLSTWIVAPIEKDIVWRTDQGIGGRVEASLWPFILSQIFEQNNQPPVELMWTLDNDAQSPIALPDDLEKKCSQVSLKVPSWIDPISLKTPPLYPLNIGQNKLSSFFDNRKKTLSRAFIVFISAIIFSLLCQISFTAFVQIKLNKEQAILNQWLAPLGFEHMSLYEIKDRITRAIESVEKMQLANNFTYSVSAVGKALNQDEKNELLGISYTSQAGLTLEFSNINVHTIAQQLKVQMPSYQVTVMTPDKGNSSNSSLIAIKKVGA